MAVEGLFSKTLFWRQNLSILLSSFRKTAHRNDPVLIQAGADISANGQNSAGQTIPLTPISLGINYDLSHAHSAFVTMYNRGRMNGANRVQVLCSSCAPANPQFK